ncbi:MAG: glucosyl-3-phosphoglycerate synthase [Actinomycetia bacterium]|nr:glucosyl-3-phosphoglycerate synthase [Actinomycetes bacterium]
MRSGIREWFDQNTSTATDWPLKDVLLAKGGRTVDVILPALNEQQTVGRIVSEISSVLMTADAPLVDDLVVVDSGSVDSTARVAAAAGARVVQRRDVFPDLRIEVGKGEAMWRALAATSGDVVVFIDADLRSFTADYVVGLLGPLLAQPEVQLVKAVYDRPLVSGETFIPAGGGRVTELVARPLLNALWPELAGIAQPLAGEYAAERKLLEGLQFPCGYGVEIGLLVDTYRQLGLAGLAQVDLGERRHRHQDSAGLANMSAQVLHAALARAPGSDGFQPQESATLLTFAHNESGFTTSEQELQTKERPPLVTTAEYLLAREVPDLVQALTDSSR